MSERSPDIEQVYDREVIDPPGFDAWIADHGFAWQKIDRGEYGFTLEEAQLRYICEDIVLWCKAFLTEPDTGEPYTFWEYQEESARCTDQDVVHMDAAEVGKTREITAQILWGQCTGMGFTVLNPSMLVAAPQQTHLDEIIRDIESHAGVADGFDGDLPLINRFWMKPKKQPHYEMRFKGPHCTKGQFGFVAFRPFGNDGDALRGVHVNALAFADEAAKVRNLKCWHEFPRAQKPGCKQRIYSVPNGDNSTYFYKLTKQAVPDLKPDEPGFRLFHWPKMLMPPPFWTPERKAEMLRRYNGSETDSGYLRNVLGQHGQQENSIWSWPILESNIRNIPEHRVIKLVVDEGEGTLHIEAYSIELKINDGKKYSEENYLAERHDDLDEYKNNTTRRSAVRNLLREFIEPITNAVLWAGADLGYSNDPTEIGVAQEIGTELRDLVRISAKGVEYWLQCELIYCLDELFNFNAQWGVDFGSAGTAVVQDLQNLEIYEDANYEDRMTGFNFAGVVDRMDEEGNVLEGEDKKGDMVAVRIPAKQLATELMTRRYSDRTWAMPYDNDVLSDLSNHTAREGARHMIYDKSNDHTIDQKRALILRKAFNEAIGDAEVFSSGVHRRDAA